MILDMLCDDRRIDRSRVLVDHVEEHTIRAVLDAGFWAGMTLYPVSKCTPERAVDMVEMYGPERLLVNSAGDWGPSKPTAVPDFILAMRLRGPPGEPDPPDRLRQPAGVLQPEPQLRLHAAGSVSERSAVGRRLASLETSRVRPWPRVDATAARLLPRRATLNRRCQQFERRAPGPKCYRG